MPRTRKPRFDREEQWLQLAARWNATVVRRRNKVVGLRIPMSGVTAVLDLYQQSSGETQHTYTRLRALYRARDDFRFRAYPRGPFSALAIFLGMQAIRVGHPGVDRDWIVKSNSEGRVQSIMQLPAVARGLGTVKRGRLAILPFRKRGVKQKRVCELRYFVNGAMKDPAQLDAIVGLFASTLEQLGRMGHADFKLVEFQL